MHCIRWSRHFTITSRRMSVQSIHSIITILAIIVPVPNRLFNCCSCRVFFVLIYLLLLWLLLWNSNYLVGVALLLLLLLLLLFMLTETDGSGRSRSIIRIITCTFLVFSWVACAIVVAVVVVGGGVFKYYIVDSSRSRSS